MNLADSEMRIKPFEAPIDERSYDLQADEEDVHTIPDDLFTKEPTNW